MNRDLQQGIVEAEALLEAVRAEESEVVLRMLAVCWARGWGFSWELPVLAWHFPTWSVRSRPFDWRIDA